MVTVTRKAKRQLKEIADQRQLDPGSFLRLATPPVWTGEGDFGIVVDSRGVMDVDVKLDGRIILLIEQEVSEHLNAVLDFKGPPDAQRFALDVF